MINTLIYLSPEKEFKGETATLVKLQIDNSLELGWRKEDILLVTNFPYEYKGVNALVVSDDNFYHKRPRSMNTTTVAHLFELGIIKDDIYWVHDFDCYQLEPMTNEELGLEAFDLGLTDFGWRARWCMGSFFFKKGSRDIFEVVKSIVLKDVEDESAMMIMTENDINNTNNRAKRLNVTYDMGMRRVESNYKRADKPIKVLHFHPHYPNVPTLDIFMYGKNGMGFPIMNERLIKLFHKHGIR